MGGIFEWLDAWIAALFLAAVMFGAWRLGLDRGRKAAAEPDNPPEGKYTDASLALLGLLLAFSFSMSLSRHEQRRAAVVADSNSIGDFYTCATLLKEPVKGKLQDVIRAYTQLKVDAVKENLKGQALEDVLHRFVQMHGQMTDLVGQAVDQKTPVAIPLTNTLNNLTSSNASRLHAFRDRLPWSVVLLLFLASAVCVFLIGQQQGKAGKAHLVGTLTFIFLVALVVYITLDLNQPQAGLINVSQEPFERLLQSMTR